MLFTCFVSQTTLAKTVKDTKNPESTKIQDYTKKKNLEELIKELLNNNPELKSLVATINAAQDRIPQASSLDDPRFSLEFSNIPIGNPSFSRTPMTGIQIYLRQNIPFPGKLKLKKKIAEAKKDQVQEEHLEKLNQLVAKFKSAYFEYVYINQAIHISHKTIQRLEALSKSLEAKYSAGQVPQQDILKTKVEMSKIRNHLIEQNKLKKILEARLSTLLNRPEKTPLKIITSYRSLTKVKYKLDEILEIAKNSRPWLHRSSHQITESEHQHKLAKKELLPDFDFSAAYRVRSDALNEPIRGQDFFSTGVSLNLPIWNMRKQNKKISQTRHEIIAAEQNKQAIEQEVKYQVEKLFLEISQLKEQYWLYHSRIIPESNAALASSKKNYEANEIDYLNVITNELDLFNNQLTLYRYYFEHEKKIAELEMAIGQPLSSVHFKGDSL